MIRHGRPRFFCTPRWRGDEAAWHGLCFTHLTAVAVFDMIEESQQVSGIELVGIEARGPHLAGPTGPDAAAAQSGHSLEAEFSGVLGAAVAQRGDSLHGRRSAVLTLELEDSSKGETLPLTGDSLPPVLATTDVDSTTEFAPADLAAGRGASGLMHVPEASEFLPEPELRSSPQTSRPREADTLTAAQASLQQAQQTSVLAEVNKAVDAGLERAGELGVREPGHSSAARSAVGTVGALPLPEPMDMRELRSERGLGERLVLMVRTGVQRAELQLDPPELGSLQLRVQIQNDQAQVQILSPHASVRDVIEQQVGRLRDLFSAEQLQLVGFSVADSGAQSGQQRQPQSGARRGAGTVDQLTGLAVPAEEAGNHSIRLGLIDQYA